MRPNDEKIKNGVTLTWHHFPVKVFNRNSSKDFIQFGEPKLGWVYVRV